MVAMVVYSVMMLAAVSLAEILISCRSVVERNRIPLCGAMERRWKRNVVCRVSSVVVVICLPISCVSSMDISCHVPAVSMANG